MSDGIDAMTEGRGDSKKRYGVVFGIVVYVESEVTDARRSPQPSTLKDVHLVLVLVISWTDPRNNDDDGPALAHPDGGLSGSLEAVYGSRSPVVWSA